MELIEAGDLAEFESILRRHRLRRDEFSLKATDTTDPKTDEVQAMQAELVVRHKPTGEARQYLVSDGNCWLELFRGDIRGGAFAAQDSLGVCHIHFS
jgi:hypothetical protein